MWGMTGDQVYDTLNNLIFAAFLLLLAIICGVVLIRVNKNTCTCAPDDYEEEELDNGGHNMSKTSGPVVGLSMPDTQGTK